MTFTRLLRDAVKNDGSHNLARTLMFLRMELAENFSPIFALAAAVIRRELGARNIPTK